MDRLFEDVDVLDRRGDPSAVEVSSVEYDSRRVVDGSLFCCLVGQHSDGHDHAAAAVASGAAGLLVERPLPLAVAQAVVAPGTARNAMARVACTWYGHPARSLTTVGVTGTNGKTTVTHLLRAVFDRAGWPTEVIGTLDGARTTPEAPDLQRRLADARQAGRRAAAVEVSSHALVQRRVDGFRFAAAVFTNLSHDHLDYHRSMESYFAAKAELFTPEHAALAVVNTGDPWGRRLVDRTTLPVVPFGADEAVDVVSLPGLTSFTWRGHRVELALSGVYNVVNAVAAATTAVALGLPEEAVVAGLGAARPVAGRFEVVETAAPFTTVVDYAHTPDGLAESLRSARRLAAGGRVLVVFGCGGDRDPDKRPAMGAVAAAGADLVFVTSDNPRHEDPGAIIGAILAGIADTATVRVEADRATAIDEAVTAARPGDVVVVAGKGHETTMVSAAGTVPFDDRLQVADAVRRRTGVPEAPA